LPDIKLQLTYAVFLWFCRYGEVARFVWQMNVRRGLRAASKEGHAGSAAAAAVTGGIGPLIDFDKDFTVPESYEGPRLEASDGKKKIHYKYFIQTFRQRRVVDCTAAIKEQSQGIRVRPLLLRKSLNMPLSSSFPSPSLLFSHEI
jgi:hypothetical protein